MARKPGWSLNRSMLDHLPVERLSMTVTLEPWRSSASARWEPINPAPPVTRIFCGRVMGLKDHRPLTVRQWIEPRRHEGTKTDTNGGGRRRAAGTRGLMWI